MKNFTNEFKIGFVIIAAILIALFFWGKTTASTHKKTYKLKTYFSHADGIKANSIVTLSGVEVGRVESTKFIYKPEETKIEVILLVDQEARVRDDSIAYIDSTGFIGDKYIGITPGNSRTFLKQDSIVISEDPVEMRKMMKRADEISKNLDEITAEVKTIVSANQEKIDVIVTNIESTTENVKELTADLKAHPWKLLFKGKEK